MYAPETIAATGCRYGTLLCSAALIAVMAAAPVAARAAVGYQVGAAASYSDNVTRAADDGIEEIVSNLNASALWSNDSPRLSAEAFAQLSYLQYYEETFDDEVIPRADVNINWNIAPARLSWVMQDRFGQIASDPFAAFTPDNIENTNVVSIGPDLMFGSDPSQLLTLSVRGEDQYYEVQPIDNQRITSALELLRRLSQTQTLSLNISGEDVRFDDESFGTDYRLYEAYLTFERSLDDFSFAIDAGGTQVEIEDESVNGLLTRLSASRAFDSGWLIQFGGEYSYTDSGSRFLLGRQESSVGPGQTVDDDNIVAAGSPLRLRQISAGATHQTARQEFSLEMYWENERFELENELDQVEFGGILTYEFLPSQLNSFRLAVGYKTVEFDAANRDDDHLEIELRYRRNMTKNLSLDFRVARAKRTSTNLDSEYEENVVGVNFSYASDVLGAMQRTPR